jgi:BON domain
MMLKHMRHKVILSMVLVGAAFSMPVFGQTGVPHSVDNTTNPNAQNVTNPDAAVPPIAPGAAVGLGQPATPVEGSSITAVTGGSSNVANAVRDTDITGKIKRALYVDAATSGSDIHVTTDNGVVTLTGQVHVKHEALEAARIAQNTPGVREVVNQLVVTSNRRNG